MMGNRYASEPGLGGGMMPQQGGQPLLGQRQPSLAHAQQLAQKNPNPVTQVQSSQVPMADVSGIQQAAQAANAKSAGEAQGNGVRDAITALMMRCKDASALTDGGLSRPQSRNLGLNSGEEPQGPKIVGTPFGIGARKPAGKPMLGAKTAGVQGESLATVMTARELETVAGEGAGEVAGRLAGEKRAEAAIQALFRAPSFASVPGRWDCLAEKRAISGQLPPPGPGSNAGNSALPPPGPPPMPGPGQAVPPQGPPPGMPPGPPPPPMDPSMMGMPPGPPPQPGVPPGPGMPPPGQPVPGTSPPDPPPPPMQHRRQAIRGSIDRLLNMKNRQMRTPGGVQEDIKHDQMAMGKMAGIDADVRSENLDIQKKPGLAMLLTGLGGGLTGGYFGGIAGLGHGHAQGRMLTGGLRGVGRGALTGGGAGVGAIAGNILGQSLGGDEGAAWGGLAGAGLGGIAGWHGASSLMNRKKRDKEAGDLATVSKKSPAQPHVPLPPLTGAMSPSPAIGGPPVASPESGGLRKTANAWMKALRPLMGGLAGGMVGAGVADGTGSDSLQGFLGGAALGAGAGGLSLLGRGARAMPKGMPPVPRFVPPPLPQAAQAVPQASMVPAARRLGAGSQAGPMPIPLPQGPQALPGQKAMMPKSLLELSPAEAARHAHKRLLEMGHTPEQAHFGAQRLFHHMTVGKFSGGAGAKAPASMPSAGQPKGPAPLSQYEISHDAPSLLPPAATVHLGRASTVPTAARPAMPASPAPAPQPGPSTQSSSSPHGPGGWGNTTHMGFGRTSPTQSPPDWLAPRHTNPELFPKVGSDWLAKLAAQDNSQPQRSSTGESKGLSYQHKPDHYMQGQDAWASVEGYFKGSKYLKGQPNPYKGWHSGEKKAFLGTAAAAGAGGGVGWGLGRLLGGDEGGARGAAIGSGAGAGGALATMLPLLAAVASPKLRAGFGKAVGNSASGLLEAARGLRPVQAAKGAYNVASDALRHSVTDPGMRKLTLGSVGLGAAGGGLAGEMAYQGSKQGFDAFLSEGEALAAMVRR